ncbi:hypothetical protein AB3S75_000683 [Citrus x aurantiifolia]
MTSTPTLAMPNFNETFVIVTDASGDGIGAILQQQGQPIAFMSRALGVTKKSWSTYAKEMLPIIEAIRVWRPYLLGRKFIIQTDQRSLKYLLEQKITTPEQQQWLAKLMGFNYEIQYRSGRENVAADALSRRPDSSALNSLFVAQVSIWNEIKTTAQDDDYMQQITHQALTQHAGPYFMRNGLIFFKGRVAVPLRLRQSLIFEAHDTKMGGHSGVLRTYKRLKQQFYWPLMFQTVHDYVAKYEICQNTKASTLKPAGLLQPLPIPCQVWDDITLDFVEGLPNSHGKNSILVVVDRLSKSAHFMALTHPFTAKTVAEKFIDGVVKLHGMPKSIISDRDPIFISKFWQEFFHMSGTQLKMSSAYHPQTDGQTEVINRCLEQYLRSFVHQWPKQWNSYLPWAEYWYNTTYHESTGMTPFLALYGRHPPVVPMYHVGSSPVHEVDQALLSRDELLRQLKQNLKMATNRMKQFADTKRRDVEFKEGDMVFLRLPPYRQTTVFRRAHQKLASKYFGPYPILRRVGQVAYELKLPTGSRVHPVFHVSLLKKYVGEMPQFSTDLPYVDDGGVLVLEPDRIIDVRWLKRGGKLVEQNLVRWKRLPHEDATWEDSEFLAKQFPNLTLEDKGPLRGGGIDMPRRSSRIPKPSNKYAGYV